MLTEEQKLEKLVRILEATDTDYASTEEVATIFNQIIETIDSKSEELEAKIDAVKAVIADLKLQKGDKGDSVKGDKGDKGDAPTNKELLALIKPLIPELSDMVTKASELALQKLTPQIPSLVSVERNIAKNTKDIEAIKNEKKLDIKPIEKRLNDVERIAQSNQVSLPQTTTHIYKNGEHLGRAKNLNFIEGPGVTFDVKQNGDRFDITVVSSGGSGAVPLAYDISDQFDGSTIEFTLPEYSAILLFTITGWAPNGSLRPTVDFTETSTTTVELTSEVSAPEAGATGIILYIPA